jgi:hypothetical protein
VAGSEDLTYSGCGHDYPIWRIHLHRLLQYAGRRWRVMKESGK